MRPNLAGFRAFIEDMDQSVDKKVDGGQGTTGEGDKMDYFGGLGDEMDRGETHQRRDG